MKNIINVYIKPEGDARIPQYASMHAAGCDLYATRDMAIRPGETKIMPLDFTMAIDNEFEAQIRPRSGLSLKTELRIPNGPGTIDSDYRDTVGVILQNIYNIANLPYQIAANPQILEDINANYKEVSLSEYLAGHGCQMSPGAAALHVVREKIYIDRNGNPYGTIYIKKGDRIAQMVFCSYKRANFIFHPNPREIGFDRGGGFGHTGND
jgi:dUTP pyrophosphatase